MALIENLLSLYQVDAQVRGLRSRLNTAERYLAAQSKQLKDLQQQYQELQTRKKHVQAGIANLDVEIKALDERLEKLRNELNAAVSNKQYSAVLTELNTVKANRAGVEDRMLADFERVEEIQEQLKTLDAQLAERTKVRDVAQAQLDQRKADVGQRLTELEAERVKAAAIIPADALSVFEKMAEDHEGDAMAPVEEIDRRSREYACGACNMHIPFDQVSTLTARGDSLVRCNSCGRILYMQEEMRGSLVKK